MKSEVLFLLLGVAVIVFLGFLFWQLEKVENLNTEFSVITAKPGSTYKEVRFIFNLDPQQTSSIKYKKGYWDIQETESASKKIMHFSGNCGVEFGEGVAETLFIRWGKGGVLHPVVSEEYATATFGGIDFDHSIVTYRIAESESVDYPFQFNLKKGGFYSIEDYLSNEEGLESLVFSLYSNGGALEDIMQCRNDFEEVLQTIKMLE